MPSQPLNIPFPLGGLNENQPFGQQPPATSRDVQNMRAIDPKTGRTRGAQRSGTSQYMSQGQTIAGARKIQDLVAVTYNESLLTFAEAGTPLLEWNKEMAYSGSVYAIVVDYRGNVVLTTARTETSPRAERDHTLERWNRSGELLTSIKIPVTPDVDSTDYGRTIALAVDEFGNAYVGQDVYCVESAVFESWPILTTGGTKDGAYAKVWKFELNAEEEYELAWSIDVGKYVPCLAVRDGKLAVGETEFATGNGSSQVEVYTDLDTATPTLDHTLTVDNLDGEVMFPRGVAIADSGNIYVTSCENSATPKIRCQIQKYGPDDTAAVDTVDNLASSDGGGMGYGIVTDGEDRVISYGPEDFDDDDIHVHKWRDDGLGLFSEWTYGFSVEPDFDYPWKYLAVDEDNHVYVPHLGGSNSLFAVLDESDGSLITDAVGTSLIHAQRAYAVGVPPDKPDYGDAAVDASELIYIGTQFGAAGTYADEALFAVRLVTITQSGTAMRSVAHGAASNYSLKYFNGTDRYIIDSGGDYSGQDIFRNRGGAGDTPYIQSTPLFGKAYFVNGDTYWYWDPKPTTTLPTGAVDGTYGLVYKWVSTGSGIIPPRCRLVESWRSRMILARDPEDPHNWHMSALGDAHDWDQFPSVIKSTQAISGNNARAGLCPDIVNTIIPYNDDLCLFGGDHSIWRLTGDPMSGGQFDLVSDITGISFGRPWCKDPRGILYFFGSRGGIYAMTPTGLPERLTRDTIERELQDIDLEDYYIRLVWNFREEGLHVFQCPFGAGGTAVSAWFWDHKSMSWWKDSFSDTAAQPTSVLVSDGDEVSDRVLLLGTEAGHINKWDEDATNDHKGSGTTFIDSYVTIGPMAPEGLPQEVKYSHLHAVLADDQDGCDFNLYATDTPDVLGTPVHQGVLLPGRNPTHMARMRGSYAFVQLRNASPDQRWAFEAMSLQASPGGKVRRR